MKELKNIKSREEYLRDVNEGRIGDFVRKGVNNFKNAFRLIAKKVKDVIAIFDNNGNVLPVTTVQAMADHFKGNENISVCGTDAMNKDIQSLGGKGCDTEARERKDSEYTDDTPDGAEAYVNWVQNDYKETNYYKNMKTLIESFTKMEEARIAIDGEEVNEDIKTLKDDERAHYLGRNEESVEGYTEIGYDEFREVLNQRIEYFCNDANKKFRSAERTKNLAPVLIFGAPGIGKSTIPNSVIRAYNEKRNNADSISIISINCGNLKPGDLLMPAFPTAVDVSKVIDDNRDNLNGFNELVKDMSDEEVDKLSKALKDSGLQHANASPQPWLPCYKKSKDVLVNEACDIYANGGILSSDSLDGKTSGRTGSGGIILLDEFLRADPNTFKEFMNLLTERQINDYVVGSKWFFIACSNRPCDDAESDKGWKSLGGPGRDRPCQIFHLNPDPEDWKKWARTKGFDETLLKFIFDTDSLHNDEYTRWHRVVNKENAGEDSHMSVTPRQWMRVHTALVLYFLMHHHDKSIGDFSLANMTIDEIKKATLGYFDKSFSEELFTWLETNCTGLDIKKIIENPYDYPMPIGMDKIKIIKDLAAQLEKYNKKSDGECSDDELTNIIKWVAINYKSDYNIVAAEFIQKLNPEIFKEEFSFQRRIYAYLTCCASFSDEEDIEEIPKLIQEYYKKTESEKKSDHLLEILTHKQKYGEFYVKNADDIVGEIRKIAKKEFPWRVKADGTFKDLFVDEDDKEVKDWADTSKND